MASKIILAGTAAVVLAAGAGGGYCLYLKPAHAARGANAAPAALVKPSKVAYVEVKELTLRLADASAEHYIKITPVLAVREAKAETFAENIPVVRDRIVTIVTGHQSSELAAPDGQLKLKKDLLDALHQEFPDAVVGIYFSGYLVE